MTIPMRTMAVLTALLLATIACGGGTETSTGGSITTAPPNTGIEGPTTTISEGTTSTMAVDPDLPTIEPARADLARRLRIDGEEIEVIAAQRVTWPDGSLGCPQPGMSYTQALVEGSRVVLRHDERVYVYHAGDDDQPFLCPSEEKDGGHEFVPPPGFNE